MSDKRTIQPLAVYSVDETANLLQCSPRTIYAKAKSGELKATKVGVAHKILGESILELLGSQTYQSTNEQQDTSGAQVNPANS